MDNEKNGKEQAGSSMVMRGQDASTFSEMEAFVKDLEGRPTERLLRDLPQLAQLSSTKFSLVSYVFATRYKQAEPREKQTIRDSVSESLAAHQDSSVGERIAAILRRLPA